jgi:imidazolonepropionase-like amidohydrolase
VTRISVLLFILLLGQASALAETFTAFADANVISMVDDRILFGHTVLVRNELIFEVARSDQLKLPEGTRRIDAKGKYLTPGLAEMHGHMQLPNGIPSSQYVTDMLFLYLANGVTTVRGMLGGGGQFELREMIQNGEVAGPNLYLAGPGFTGGSISSPKQASRRVVQQFNEGWDLLKVLPGLTTAEYDAMAETAHRLGIRFAGHVPQAVGLKHALQMGQHTFDHIDGYLEQLDFPAKAYVMTEMTHWAQQTKSSGAWIVPTLVVWDHIIGLSDPNEVIRWDELRYWPKTQVDNWYRRQQRSHPDSSARRKELQAYSAARSVLLKVLNDEGAGILLGSDSPQAFSVPGFSIHREMAAMVAAGMTTAEVLASGTRNIGTYLQGSKALGVIAPGNQADLILMHANPLDDINNTRLIAGVMSRGLWLDSKTIEDRLDKIEENASGSGR